MTPEEGVSPEGELMVYKDMFTVLVVDSCIERSPSLRDAGMRIVGHLREDHHLRTDVLGSTKDAIIRLRHDASVACLLLEWGGKTGGIDAKRVLDTVADVGLEIPVFLLAPAENLAREQAGLLRDEGRGLIYPEEDAPDFVARYVNRHFEAYIERLKTPFFGRIIEFNESGSEMWTCPGHNGGMFYRRSPVGRVFYEYLGETVFRTDLDNSVVELGDLLVHEGPAREAEAAAAEIFGADRTYFVLNGTSTSNKVAAGALVSRGDLVLFDRNNHKSSHHGALVLAGGIPVYLPADRNPQGLIGPIDPGALDEDRIRAAIRDCPLVTDSRRRAERPFRLAIIEQCSYDGTVYNVRAILDRIGHLCDYVLFDEAWAGFMKFHRCSPATTRWAWTASARATRASSLPSPRTSSWPASRRPPRSTSGTGTSPASHGTSPSSGSTRRTCCTPRPRRSTRCSPRWTSARR
jgi:ornithine decarboxylase